METTAYDNDDATNDNDDDDNIIAGILPPHGRSMGCGYRYGSALLPPQSSRFDGRCGGGGMCGIGISDGGGVGVGGNIHNNPELLLHRGRE